jgi:hypothetical protein
MQRKKRQFEQKPIWNNVCFCRKNWRRLICWSFIENVWFIEAKAVFGSSLKWCLDDTLFLGIRHSFCGFNCMVFKFEVRSLTSKPHLKVIFKQGSHTFHVRPRNYSLIFFRSSKKWNPRQIVDNKDFTIDPITKNLQPQKKKILIFSFFFHIGIFLVETREISTIFWSSSGLTTTIKSFNSNFIFRRFCKDFL